MIDEDEFSRRQMAAGALVYGDTLFHEKSRRA